MVIIGHRYSKSIFGATNVPFISVICKAGKLLNRLTGCPDLDGLRCLTQLRMLAVGQVKMLAMILCTNPSQGNGFES